MAMAILYLVLTVVQAACYVAAARTFFATRSVYDLFPMAVIFSLAYDNLVLALGESVGPGDTLLALNFLRYLLHALLTPLLIIWGFGLARRMGFQWANNPRNHALICVLATAMILLGFYSDIVRWLPELRLEQGITRYVNVGGIKGPPVPSIVTIITLGLIGWAIFRRTRSWSLLAGAVVMFVLAMVGLRVPLASNIGEVFMSGGVVASGREPQPIAAQTGDVQGSYA